MHIGIIRSNISRNLKAHEHCWNNKAYKNWMFPRTSKIEQDLRNKNWMFPLTSKIEQVPQELPNHLPPPPNQDQDMVHPPPPPPLDQDKDRSGTPCPTPLPSQDQDRVSPPPAWAGNARKDMARAVCLLRFHAGGLSCCLKKKNVAQFIFLNSNEKCSLRNVLHSLNGILGHLFKTWYLEMLWWFWVSL